MSYPYNEPNIGTVVDILDKNGVVTPNGGTITLVTSDNSYGEYNCAVFIFSSGKTLHQTCKYDPVTLKWTAQVYTPNIGRDIDGVLKNM